MSPKPTQWGWFPAFRDAYRQKFGLDLLLADENGAVIEGEVVQTDCLCQSLDNNRRREAGEQTLYWGETIINLCCDEGYAMWAVPVMDNNRVIGNMVAQGIDLEAGGKAYMANLQLAADQLLVWALRDNLVSTAAILLARQKADREKERFYALEHNKHFVTEDLRAHYLREEPALLSAIRQSDLGEARAILNRVLVSIYSLGGQRMDLLKSCVLELIVMMSRAAVEGGADPSALLGANYRSLSELAAIEDEEDLAHWVRQMLESLIEAIRTNDRYPHSILLTKALSYMQDHLGDNLRREVVARHAGLSSGHLSQIMLQHLGRSFSDLLTQLRVDRAKELLRQTDLTLTTIAQECGFYDQSHLNKSFRKQVGRSPGSFRK
ncbi:MAG TPA: AraC family transcriptional regulator [Oceanipulchritudo sp.]|nr:AraC family transcriptional regulator [Oceanipulchritudo sp.]